NLDYYGRQGQLEYDFVVAPGADPNVIRLGFSGADQLRLDAQGELIIHAAGQDIVQHKPVVYQDVNGVRQEIASAFVLPHSPSSPVPLRPPLPPPATRHSPPAFRWRGTTRAGPWSSTRCSATPPTSAAAATTSVLAWPWTRARATPSSRGAPLPRTSPPPMRSSRVLAAANLTPSWRG